MLDNPYVDPSLAWFSVLVDIELKKFKFTAYFCFVNVSHVTNAAAVLTLNDGLVW